MMSMKPLKNSTENFTCASNPTISTKFEDADETLDMSKDQVSSSNNCGSVVGQLGSLKEGSLNLTKKSKES